MPRILDGKYTLGAKLGEGGFCEVWEAFDDTGNKYAVKTWKKDHKKMFEDETKVLGLPEHPYLVKYIAGGRKAQFENTSNNARGEVTYILMEHVSGGEFLQSLIDHSGFNDRITRYYFKQMLQAIHYLHENGLAHRDLKPDNMMFNEDGSGVKITDFGFTIPTIGRERTGWATSQVGTSSYMAPEIIAGTSYQAFQADVYSLGVILFIMRFGNMPMEIAKSTDKQFKCLVGNRPDLFWSMHKSSDSHGVITDEFKELILGMLHPEPELRWDLADILVSDFMKGPIASQEEVLGEMNRRKEVSEQQARQNRARAAQNAGTKTTRRDVDMHGKKYVLVYESEEQQANENVIKVDPRVVNGMGSCQKQLINCPADETLNRVIEHLYKAGLDQEKIQMVEGQWMIEFELQKNLEVPELDDDEEEKKDEGEEPLQLKESLRMTLEVLKDESDDSDYLVARKIVGPIMYYRDVWNGILENVQLLD